MSIIDPPKVILTSSSPFRKALLERLNFPFECYAPDIDETRHDNEPASDYVCRLSAEKAQLVSGLFPDAVIIGSDQCAVMIQLHWLVCRLSD